MKSFKETSPVTALFEKKGERNVIETWTRTHSPGLKWNTISARLAQRIVSRYTVNWNFISRIWSRSDVVECTTRKYVYNGIRMYACIACEAIERTVNKYGAGFSQDLWSGSEHPEVPNERHELYVRGFRRRCRLQRSIRHRRAERVKPISHLTKKT